MNIVENIMRPAYKSGLLAGVLFCTAFTGCSDWTEPNPLTYYEEQYWEAENWEEYAADMRAYRETDHNIVYVRLHNSPEGITSEKDFLRSIPDSVDIVSLTNADNMSSYDMEDLSIVKSLGMRVLYQIDYSGRADTDFSAEGAFEAYIDMVIESVDKYGLDGWAISGTYTYGDTESAADVALLLSRLDEVKKDGQLIVLEGDPRFISDERDRRKLDYVVAATDGASKISEVSSVASAAVRAGIRPENLILSAKAGSALMDINENEFEAVGETVKIVQSESYAGIAVYDLTSDYWSSEDNYPILRSAIATLNPSN